MLHIDGQVHHDTHAIPMGNYVIPMEKHDRQLLRAGEYKIADTTDGSMIVYHT
jgi:hypothetical protein